MLSQKGLGRVLLLEPLVVTLVSGLGEFLVIGRFDPVNTCFRKFWYFFLFILLMRYYEFITYKCLI